MSKSKKNSAKKTTKAAATPATTKPKKERGGCLDTAAKLLAASKEPMNCKALVETMLAKGLWKTKGKTPAQTLYSAILREITTKGKESRFKKTDRGLFASNA